jgi:hypothetical protein
MQSYWLLQQVVRIITILLQGIEGCMLRWVSFRRIKGKQIGMVRWESDVSPHQLGFWSVIRGKYCVVFNSCPDAIPGHCYATIVQQWEALDLILWQQWVRMVGCSVPLSRQADKLAVWTHKLFFVNSVTWRTRNKHEESPSLEKYFFKIK